VISIIVGIVMMSILMFIINIFKNYKLVERNRFNYLNSIKLTTYKSYDELDMSEIEL